MRLILLSIAFLCLGATSVRAEDEPKPWPQPPAAALDASYQEVYKNTTDNYIGSLPKDWASWKDRFTGKLTTNGTLRAVSGVMLSAADDRQLQLLNWQDAELYRCRLQGGYVGMGVQFSFNVTLNEGAKIEEVLKDSPADKAKIRSGGTIVALDGKRLAGMDYVEALLLILESQSTTRTIVVKEGEKETEFVLTRKSGEKMGIAFNVRDTTMTAAVTRVLPNSPAEKAGLRPGDLVTHTFSNQVKTQDPDYFMGQVSDKLGSTIELTIKRGEETSKQSIVLGIVENQDLAFGFTPKSAKAKATVRLTNLDWAKVVTLLDANLQELSKDADFVIDLRGAGGDDPEIAARIASRFVESGDLINYWEKRDGKEMAFCYRLGRKENKPVLLAYAAGEAREVEQVPEAVANCHIEILVDEYTNGTAEALAYKLQEARVATITGAAGKTAQRNRLVTTTVYQSGEETFYLAVPTKRLVDLNQKDLVVVPNTSTKVTQHGRLVAHIMLSLICFVVAALTINYVCQRLFKKGHPAKLRWLFLAALATATVVCLVKHVPGMLPKSDAQKAAAYAIDILSTDEDVQQDHLRHAHVERGPRDVKLEWNQEPGPLAQSEIKAGSRMATMISEGDVDGFRALVASYAYKPYARAQMASSLNMAMGKVGANIHIMWYGGNYFVSHSDLVDGQFSVAFTPLNDEPKVYLMLRHPTHTSFQTDESSLVSGKEAFQAMKLDYIRCVLSHQAKEAAKQR